MRLLFSFLLLGVLASGCATTGGADSGSPSSVVGPTWTLVALGANAPFTTDGTITFGTNGRLNGSTGCNTYVGSYTLGTGGALTLSQVGSTRMACPGPAMEQENRFLEGLNRATRVDVRGNRLMLIDGSDVLLTFEAPRGTAGQSTLNGTVTYRERIALPPSATVTVRLLDVSRADAPSATLGQTTFDTAGRQVPIPFSLTYDASRIDPRNRYAVRAEIRDTAGSLLWTTDTVYPVITNGAPTDGVELQVVQATGGAVGDASGALVGPEWRLSEIRSASGVTLSIEAGAPYSLMFGADGRYSGQADCNRIGGEFEAGADGALLLRQGLSTLAACPDGSAAGDFLTVLGGVDRYGLDGSRLLLGGPAGSLTFLRRGAPDFGGMPPRETGRDDTYACPGPGAPFTFRTRTGPGEIALWLPSRFERREGGTYRVLGQVPAASGVRYQDGPVVFWTHGLTEARLEVDGETFTCTQTP